MGGTLLPAENLRLPPEDVALLVRPAAAPYVWAAEHTPWDNETRHQWVKGAVMAAYPLLQGSVKELRGIPPELFGLGVDLAIKGLCKLIKEVMS